MRLIVFLGLVLLLSAQSRIEEQRKYSSKEKVDLPTQSFMLGEFRFWPHDQYTTTDIYFSNKNNTLISKGWGMRLRRVVKGQALPAYVVQLKSEMEIPGASRIEEEDRDFKDQSIEGVKISEIMDRVTKEKKISHLDQRLLAAWMARKQNSSLAPFQELRRQGLDIGSLYPVVVGYSVRQRYHIILDREEKISPLLLLKDSEKNPLLLPPIFKERPYWVWLMEASWDKATFYAVNDNKNSFQINELEVENKYRPREMGTQLLNQLEPNLMKKFGLNPGKESKFLRAHKSLVENK